LRVQEKFVEAGIDLEDLNLRQAVVEVVDAGVLLASGTGGGLPLDSRYTQPISDGGSDSSLASGTRGGVSLHSGTGGDLPLDSKRRVNASQQMGGGNGGSSLASGTSGEISLDSGSTQPISGGGVGSSLASGTGGGLPLDSTHRVSASQPMSGDNDADAKTEAARAADLVRDDLVRDAPTIYVLVVETAEFENPADGAVTFIRQGRRAQTPNPKP
jgi:hypothetical protein